MSFDSYKRKWKAEIETLSDKKLIKTLEDLVKLVEALDEKSVDESLIIDQLAAIEQELIGDAKISKLKGLHTEILKKVRTAYGYITPGYHQNQWMILGMTMFGLPLGVVFAMTIDNMAFLGIGLPIGMPIGMIVGMSIDKKAKDQGKMLNLQVG